LIPTIIPGLILAPLAACGPSYSPDTYSANAVQQANKAQQGIIIGVRPVRISAAGTVGTITGAAAGGIAGAQATTGAISAFTALGGSLVGGIAGSAVEHATDDTDAFEYIVKENTGDLVSVTQKDKEPLALGLKVLVIAGNQARIIPDYTDSALAQTIKPPPAAAAKKDASDPAKKAKPGDATPSDAISLGAIPSVAIPSGESTAVETLTGATPTGATPSVAVPSGASTAVAVPSGVTPVVAPVDKAQEKPAT
jgi:outer membrane lipoprotein SlyB